MSTVELPQSLGKRKGADHDSVDLDNDDDVGYESERTENFHES